MESMTMERAIALSPVATDVWESVQRPWAWESGFVPGSIIMAMAAAAAYETVGDDFAIDSLHASFLSSTKQQPRLRIRVQRLSDGGRFAHRIVTVEQADAVLVHITATFLRPSAMAKGRAMTHAVERVTDYAVDRITLDDLALLRTELGPWMKFQRFHPVYTGRADASSDQSPASRTYTSAAQISPPIQGAGPRLHALGLIALSDYHVLDCPPTLHGLTFGMPAIGDTSQSPTPYNLSMITSLNHSIHFHLHHGFRADDLCYVEATTPWTSQRRGEINSRIFSSSGHLIATCKQEGYYVFNETKQDSKL